MITRLSLDFNFNNDYFFGSLFLVAFNNLDLATSISRIFLKDVSIFLVIILYVARTLS